jgi:hypothetical protein
VSSLFLPEESDFSSKMFRWQAEAWKFSVNSLDAFFQIRHDKSRSSERWMLMLKPELEERGYEILVGEKIPVLFASHRLYAQSHCRVVACAFSGGFWRE